MLNIRQKSTFSKFLSKVSERLERWKKCPTAAHGIGRLGVKLIGRKFERLRGCFPYFSMKWKGCLRGRSKIWHNRYQPVRSKWYWISDYNPVNLSKRSWLNSYFICWILYQIISDRARLTLNDVIMQGVSEVWSCWM